MANEDHDLDLDDDLDDGLDLPDLDFDDPESDPSSRSPVDRVAGGFSDGLQRSSLNRSTQKKLIENTLPKGYDSAFEATYDAADNARDLYDTAAERLRPAVKDAKKIGRKVREKASPYLPKWLDDKLESWSAEDQDGQRTDDYDPQENEIQTTLANIFQTQQEEKAEDQVADETNRQTDRALEDARHLDNKSQLGLIHSAIGRIVGYHEDIATRFQKKSLELQYRQYYVAKDQYSLLKTYAEESGQSLVDIRKNTALPEFVKMKGSERVKQMLRDKTLGRIGEGLAGFTRDFGKNLFENIKGRVSDIAGTVADGLADVSGMMEDVGDSDIDSLDMTGGLVGEAAGGFAAKGIGKLIGKYAKDNEDMARIGADLDYFVQGGTGQAAQALTERLEGRIKTLNADIDAKESEDEKVPLRMRGELKLLESLQGIIPRFTEEGQFGMSSADLSEEVAAYTELTDKTITETIPGLLSEILREAEMIRSGSSEAERRIYDFDRGEVVRESQLQDDIKDRIAQSGDVRGLQDKVNKVVNLLDEDNTLKNDERAQLADQIEKDIFQNKAFTIENYADADNLDDMSKDTADKVAALVSSRFMDGGKFKKSREASEARRDMSRSYADAKLNVPEYKELIGRSAATYGSGLLGRAGLSEYTGKDGLHETRAAAVRDIFKNLDDEGHLKRSTVQYDPRNVLDDISRTNVTGQVTQDTSPQPQEDLSKFSNLLEGAKRWVEPYLQVFWETMDETKVFVEGIYDFLIERFDNGPSGNPPYNGPGGGPSGWNRSIWKGPLDPPETPPGFGPPNGPTGPSSSGWGRRLTDLGERASGWRRDIYQGGVGFLDSALEPKEGGIGQKLGIAAGGLLSKAKGQYDRYKESDDKLGLLKSDSGGLRERAKGHYDTLREQAESKFSEVKGQLSERYEGSTLQKHVNTAQGKFDEITSDLNKVLLDNGIDVVQLQKDGKEYLDKLYADAREKGEPYVKELTERLESLDKLSKDALDVLRDDDKRSAAYRDAKEATEKKLSSLRESAIERTESIYAELKTEEGRDALVKGMSDSARDKWSQAKTKSSSLYDDAITRVKSMGGVGALKSYVDESEGVSSLVSKFSKSMDVGRKKLPTIDLRSMVPEDQFTEMKDTATDKTNAVRGFLKSQLGNAKGLVDDVVSQVKESDINKEGAERLVKTAEFKATIKRYLDKGKSALSKDSDPEPLDVEKRRPRGVSSQVDDASYRPWMDELKEHLDSKTELLVKSINEIDNRSMIGKTFDSLRNGVAGLGGGLMNYYGKTFSGMGSLLSGAGSGVGNLFDKLFTRKDAAGKDKGDGKTVSDVYMAGVDEPIILARDLKRGLYSDYESGDPIFCFEDIDGPVVDPDGNIVITAEDIEQERVNVITEDGMSPIGRFLSGGASLLGKGLKGLFGGYWNLARGIQKTVFSTAKKAIGFVPGLLFGKEKEKKAKDVYVKGESKPRLRAVVMKTGGYLSVDTGEPVRTIQDIEGEITDLDNNIVLSHEDISKGLVDAKGKELDLSTGRSGGLIKGALNLTRKGLDTTIGLTKGVFNASSKIVKGAGSMIGGMFGGLFGGKLRGEKADELLSSTDKQTNLLTEIRDLIDKRVNPPDDFYDRDDDGMRDGGWRSKLYGDAANDDGEPDDDKARVADKSKSMLSSLGSLFGGGGDPEEEGDDYSYVDMSGDEKKDKDGKNRKNKPRRGPKPKGKWGRALQAAKNFGGKALKFTGLSKLGGVTRTAGSFLWNNVIRSAGSWAIRGLWALGSAAVAILGAPVAITIGAVAAVGVGAYFLYKWADQADLDDVNRVRYTQYGANLEDKEHVGMIYRLENFLQDHVKLKKGEPPVLADVDPEELLDEVDLDPEEDEEQVEKFYEWLQDRFKPVYLTWAAVSHPYMDDFDLEDMEDQLEVKEKIEVLKKSLFEDGPDSPYRKMTSPYKENPKLSGFSQVQTEYQEVMDKLKSQLKDEDSEKVDTSKAKDVKTDEREDGISADEMKAMTPAERLRLSASKQENENTKRKMLKAADRLEKRQKRMATTLAGAAVGADSITVSLDKILDLPDASLVDDPVGKTRMLAYGVNSVDESDKVQDLLALERDVRPMMSTSKNKVVFKGSTSELFETYAKQFGRDKDSSKDRAVWTEWFNKRFIPVLGNYIGYMNRYNGDFYNPMKLKGNGAYEIAAKIRSTVNESKMSIWTVSASPWPDYQLSDNSSDVRKYIGELLTGKSEDSTTPVDKGRENFGIDPKDKGRLGGEKSDNYVSDEELFNNFESPGRSEKDVIKDIEDIDKKIDTTPSVSESKDVTPEDPSNLTAKDSENNTPRARAERMLGAAARLRESAERQSNRKIKQTMLRKAGQLERTAKRLSSDAVAKPLTTVKPQANDDRDNKATLARAAVDRETRRQQRSVASAQAQNTMHTAKLTDNTNRMVSILNQSVGVQQSMADRLSEISQYLKDQQSGSGNQSSKEEKETKSSPKPKPTTSRSGDVEPAINMKR